VRLNLGATYLHAEDLTQAVDHLTQAVHLHPEASAAWSNLGMALALQGQEQAAEQSLQCALALAPDSAQAQANLGYLWLRQGRWAEAWPLLDRARRPLSIGQALACPRWDGSDLRGRRVLLEHEPGHGDTVQFARYIPLLKAQGAATVGLVCHPGLRRLLQGVPGLDAVWGLDEQVPGDAWDTWSPMISLARYLPAAEHALHATPYLSVPGSVREAWSTRIAKRGRRVGLVWRGNPHFANDHHRSLSTVDALEPIWSQSGLSFYSLQTGAHAGANTEPPTGGHGALPVVVTDLAPQLSDFADTAAVIEHLDLLITVDTAVAHVAGALGRPCWVLLPAYLCDWRWGRDSATTRWYPSLRLFRQPAVGDWASAIAAVAHALSDWRAT
jgi:hypothetical protein